MMYEKLCFAVMICRLLHEKVGKLIDEKFCFSLEKFGQPIIQAVIIKGDFSDCFGPNSVIFFQKQSDFKKLFSYGMKNMLFFGFFFLFLKLIKYFCSTYAKALCFQRVGN